MKKRVFIPVILLSFLLSGCKSGQNATHNIYEVEDNVLQDIDNNKNITESFYNHYSCNLKRYDYNYILKEISFAKFKQIQPQIAEYQRLCRFLLK